MGEQKGSILQETLGIPIGNYTEIHRTIPLLFLPLTVAGSHPYRSCSLLFVGNLLGVYHPITSPSFPFSSREQTRRAPFQAALRAGSISRD